jgi:hypothetical protein
MLLGPEGKELLALDGEPTLIRFAVPGEVALSAANPHEPIEGIRKRGGIPNLARELLEAWAFWIAKPGFKSRDLKVDCGMVFRHSVPPDWILGFEAWNGENHDRS